MKKVVAIAVVALVLVMGTQLKAQSPSQQFGIGAMVGGMNAVTAQYALSPAFHLGAGLGLELRDGNSFVSFAPYAKFIFAGSKELKPFLLGIFSINSSSSGQTGVEGSTSTALNFGGGVEYFVTPNFGIWAGIVVLNLPLSPSGSKVGFGILSPTVGAEWFL